MERKFDKSFFGYTGLVVAGLIPVGFVVAVLRNVNQRPIQLSSMPGLCILFFLFLSPCLIIARSLYLQYSMRFTNMGIIRKFNPPIYWSEVVEISSTMFMLVVKAENKSCTINLVLYKKVNEIVDFVREQTGLTH